MLELAILGLLEDQELHGYEIRKRLRDELGFFSNVSFGSLYPALSRLERSGAVPGIEDSRRARSAPGSHDGVAERRDGPPCEARRSGPARGRRGRKVYRITDEGRRQFTELLDSERRPAATTTPAASGCGWPLPGTCPPMPACGCSSGGGASCTERLAEARGAAAAAEERLDPYARSLHGAHHGIDRARHLVARPADRRRAGPGRRGTGPRGHHDGG